MKLGARVLLTASLCVYVFAQGDTNPYQTPANNAPLSYNLSIDTDMENFQYSGQVDILVISFFPSSKLVVNWVGPTVPVEQTKFKTLLGRDISVVSVSSDPDHELITIEVNEELKDGFVYICSIQFSSTLGTSPADGYYRYSYLDTTAGVTRWVALTSFQYVNARRVFPCYDEPELKAKVQITLTHRSQYTALSNAPVQSVMPHDNKEGWVVTTFEQTESLSTYKLGFMVAEIVNAASVEAGVSKFPLRAWTSDKDPNSALRFSLETAAKIIGRLENLTLYDFPLDKLDIVTSYDNDTGVDLQGIDNWGLIVLRNDIMLDDTNTGRLERFEKVWSLGNALADQWIGCLVTVEWWTSLWAFEGLRTELTSIVLDQVFPDWNVHNYKRAECLNVVFKYDSLNSSQNISTSLEDPKDINNVFDNIASSKGFLLYHTVSTFLGSLFGQAVDYYMQFFNFGAAEAENLYTYIEKMTLHQDILPDNTSLTQIMGTWTYQPGYPVLTVQRDVGKLTITQKRFLLSGKESSGKECWWVPVTFTTAKSPYFNQSIVGESWWDGCSLSQLMLQTDAGLEDWIVIINKASVVCHVNYDSHSWSLLVTLLTTGDVTLIDEMNCYQLVKDVFALAQAGQVEYSLAFQVLKYLKRESRFIPWLAGTQTLANLEKFLWRSKLYSKYKEFVRALVEDVYKANSELNAATASVEEWRYRLTLAQLACDAQVTACVSNAVALFKQWVTSETTPTINSLTAMVDPVIMAKVPFATRIDPDLRRMVYREGVRQGAQAEFEFVWNKYLTSPSDTEQRILLDALACTPQQDLLDQLLNKILDPASGLKRQHLFVTFCYVTQNSPEGFDLAIKFLDENFQTIYNIKETIVDYISQLLERMVVSSEIEQVKMQTSEHPNMFLHSRAILNRSLAVAEDNLRWMNKYLPQMSSLLAV